MGLGCVEIKEETVGRGMAGGQRAGRDGWMDGQMDLFQRAASIQRGEVVDAVVRRMGQSQTYRVH